MTEALAFGGPNHFPAGRYRVATQVGFALGGTRHAGFGSPVGSQAGGPYKEVVYDPITGGSAGLGAPEPGGEEETSVGLTFSEIGPFINSPMGAFVGGKPKHIFEPPDEGLWGGDDYYPGACVKSMYGSARDCEEPSDGTVRSTADFAAMDVGAWAATVQLVGDWTDADEEFLYTAWALVNENMDLVKYATCWVFGEDTFLEDLADAVVAVFSGNRVRFGNPYACMKRNFTFGWDLDSVGPLDYVPFMLVRAHCEDKKFMAYGLPATNYIGICTDVGSGTMSSYYEERYFAAWAKGDTNPVDALCAALDLACILVHEMVHVCGQDLDDWLLGTGRDGVRCDGAYMVENIFRWAMMKRYAGTGAGDGAGDSGCCSTLAAETLFGSYDSYTMSERCVVVTGSRTMGGPDPDVDTAELEDRLRDRLHPPPVIRA